MDRKIFSSRSPRKVNMLVATLISLVLIVVDAFVPAIFDSVQKAVKISFDPLLIATNYTATTSGIVGTGIRSKTDLQNEIERLKQNQLTGSIQLQKLAQLEQDNAQYRNWLGLPAIQPDRLLFAEIIGHTVDLTSNVLILNRGRHNGVHLGQFVVDAKGLMGQVTEVYPLTSRLMLLSDKHHAVSVRIQRTGMLAVLSGSGDSSHLTLDYVPATADVRKGDVLVSSGLGGQINAGYPTGIVDQVKKLGKNEFSEISVTPIASLQGSSLVALIDYSAPVVVDVPALPATIDKPTVTLEKTTPFSQPITTDHPNTTPTEPINQTTPTRDSNGE